MKKAKKQTSLQQRGVDGDDDEVVDIIAEQRAAVKSASSQQQNKSADESKQVQIIIVLYFLSYWMKMYTKFNLATWLRLVKFTELNILQINKNILKF